MDFSRDPVLNPIYGGIRRGIQVALDNECWGAAVILMFSAMDAMANLARPEEHPEVKDDDFMRWVERYIVLNSPHRITPEELYSIRCAVLHTYGVKSRRTAMGRARVIAFTITGKSPIVYNPQTVENFMLLDIQFLAAALFRGVDRFMIDTFADPVKKKLVEPRLKELLNTVPYSKLEQEQGKKNKNGSSL